MCQELEIGNGKWKGAVRRVGGAEKQCKSKRNFEHTAPISYPNSATSEGGVKGWASRWV